MNQQYLKEATAAYIAAGGKIKQCAAGDCAIRALDMGLSACRCGCRGDYTDHSMRAAESGRCASILVR